MENPGLFLPGKKPIGPIVVDWSHPLARGVEICLPLNRHDINIVNGERVKVNGSPIFNVKDGATQLYDWGADSHLRSKPRLNNGSGAIVILTSGLHGVGFCRLVQGGGAGYNNTIIYRNSADNSIGFRLNNDTAVLYTSGANALNPVGNIFGSSELTAPPRFIVLTWDSAKPTRQIWLDGVLADGSSAPFIDAGWGDEINFFADSASGNDTPGGKKLVLFYSRFLQSDEILSLTSDPYQFLIPA